MNRDILYFAGGEWDLYAPRGYDLMQVLAASGSRILWVDPFATRVPKLALSDASRIAARLKRVLAGVREPAPGLWVCSPLALPFDSGPAVRGLNRRLQGLQLRQAMARLGMQRPVVWTTTPLAEELIRTLDCGLLLYDIQDEYTRFPGKNHARIREGETLLLARADLVLVVSEQLRQVKRPPSGHEPVLVPNGVDYDLFSSACAPGTGVAEPMRSIPGPVAGYMGNIYERLDCRLVAETAGLLPDWSFVFVGLVRSGVEGLAGLPNVHFLGMKPRACLPSYLKAFDVAILPHRVDPFTVCQNPVKLYEYLAAGLPIVSTPLQELEPYREVVRFGGDAAEFAASLRQALEDRQPERLRRRQEIARANTWGQRASQVQGLLEARLGHK